MTGYKPDKRGYGYMGICPAHEDLRPSLSIFTYKGNLVFNCFRGCNKETIKQLINVGAETVNKGIVKYDSTPFWELEIAKTYDYCTAEGKLLYQKVRFIPKTFAIRYKKKTGKWGWGINGYNPVLYNLPNVINSHTIFIAEGEKNVDVINSWGMVGTCNYDGAGKWLTDYNKYLFGKTIYIIPDNDPPGLEHANLVYASVCKVARVKIVELPGLSHKQDIFDWVEMGYTKEDFLKQTSN